MAKKLPKKVGTKTRAECVEAQSLPNTAMDEAIASGMSTAEAVKLTKDGKKKATKKSAKESMTRKVVTYAIQTLRVILYIAGRAGSRLVMNRWSEKAFRQMLAKQMGITMPKEPRDPQLDFVHSVYYLPREDGKPYDMKDYGSDVLDKGLRALPYQDGVRFGFPVVGVKEAMASTAYRKFGLPKNSVYGSLFIHGEPSLADGVSSVECAEIIGGTMSRFDFVKNAGIGRVADLRFRADFHEWVMRLEMEYEPSMISLDDIVNLLTSAGHSVGIGEYRVEKGGEWGRFEVIDPVEAAKRIKQLSTRSGTAEMAPIDFRKMLSEAAAKRSA